MVSLLMGSESGHGEGRGEGGSDDAVLGDTDER